MVFRRAWSPSAGGGGADQEWKVTVVVLLLLLDAGSVGENENLDGFLEPVNLLDLMFNVELLPADGAGTRQSSTGLSSRVMRNVLETFA